MENDFYGVYELKDGAIVRFRQFETREEALRLAGLSP